VTLSVVLNHLKILSFFIYIHLFDLKKGEM